MIGQFGLLYDMNFWNYICWTFLGKKQCLQSSSPNLSDVQEVQLAAVLVLQASFEHTLNAFKHCLSL